MPIRELLETADFFPEPMAVLSANGTIDASNRPFAEQFGLTPRSITGRRLDTLAVASAAAIGEYLRACAHSQKAVQSSLTLNGRAKTVAFQARGVAYPPGSAPSAPQVLLRLDPKRGQVSREADIQHHERPFDWREVEASLHRQSQILEVTLASIADAVIVSDARGQVTFLNSVAAALTGWPLESARGRPLKTIFPLINERTRNAVVDPVSLSASGSMARSPRGIQRRCAFSDTHRRKSSVNRLRPSCLQSFTRKRPKSSRDFAPVSGSITSKRFASRRADAGSKYP
jgi:PAS domain-containing protein